MIYSVPLEESFYQEILDHIYSLRDRCVCDHSRCLVLTPNHTFSYSLKRAFKEPCILPKIVSCNDIFENFALENCCFEYINFHVKSISRIYTLLKKEKYCSINEAAFLFKNLLQEEKQDHHIFSKTVCREFDFYEKYKNFQKQALDETLNQYEHVVIAGIYITDEISKHVYEIGIRKNYPIFVQGMPLNYHPDPEHFLYHTLDFQKKRGLGIVSTSKINSDIDNNLDPIFFPGINEKSRNQKKYNLQLRETNNEYYLVVDAVTHLLKYSPEVALVTSNQTLLKKIEAELQKKNISLFFSRNYTTHRDGIFLLKLLDLAIFGRTEINLIALLKHPYVYAQNSTIVDYIEGVYMGTIKSNIAKKEAIDFLEETNSWAENFHQTKNFAEYHIRWADLLTNQLDIKSRRILTFIKTHFPELNDIYEYKEVLSLLLKEHCFYPARKNKQHIDVFSPKEASFLPHKNIVLLDCTEEDFSITDPIVMLNLFHIISTKNSVAIFDKEKPLSRLLLQIQHSHKKQFRESNESESTTKIIEETITKSDTLYVPVELLPKRLTPTMIEVLINEPYAFYTRYVLGIKKVDPLGTRPSYREFGYVMHRVFQSAGKSYFSYEEYSQLLFDALSGYMKKYPYTRNLWLPRGLKILEQFAMFHNERLENIVTLENEKEISAPLSNGLELFCRLDRAEFLKDGTVTIVEFKTGTLPTFKEIGDLTKPQLPLQGLILQKSMNVNIGSIMYCKPSIDNITVKKLRSHEEIITATHNELERILRLYISGKFNFLATKVDLSFPKQ